MSENKIEAGAVKAVGEQLGLGASHMGIIAYALVSIAMSQRRQADSMDRMESAGMVTPEVMFDVLHDFKHG